jgi:hypothetical protein
MNTKPKTRQDIIDEIERNNEILTPPVVAEFITMLAVLMANQSEKMATNTKLYYKKWVEIRETVETDGRAEKIAKSTDEYYNKNKGQIDFDCTVELINALKKRMSVFEEDWKQSGKQ